MAKEEMSPPVSSAAPSGNTGAISSELLRQRNVPDSVPATSPAVTDKEDLKKSQTHATHRLPSRGSLPVALLLTALALFTRLYKIGWANFVVWDEAHLGKFAFHYIKRTFYHDVHPPLGKMLNGIAGMLAGYNEQFKFESGGVYPEDLNYTFIRAFNALFGALLVPLAYYTGVHLKLSAPASIFLALLVLCGMHIFLAYCAL